MKKQEPEELVMDRGEFEAMMGKALGPKPPSEEAPKPKASRKRSKRPAKGATR